MAIIDHFEVRICIEGERAHEYNDEDLNLANAESPVPTVAKYVEAKSGQKFSLGVHLKKGYLFPPDFNSLSWDVYIDGKHMTGRIMLAEDYITRESLKSVIYCKRSVCAGQWIKHPFTFWDLDITQDSVKLDPKSMMKYGNLGIIEVRVMPYVSWGRRDRGNSAELPVTLHQSVSEKALKGRAVTLGAGLGDAIPCQPSHIHDGLIVGSDPLAKFVYHYRTKKSLQDLMVVPKDDLENMTAEELRPLLRQQLIDDMFRLKKEPTPRKEPKSKLKRDRNAGIDDDILEITEVKKVKVEAEVIEIDSD